MSRSFILARVLLRASAHHSCSLEPIALCDEVSRTKVFKSVTVEIPLNRAEEYYTTLRKELQIPVVLQYT